MKKKIIDVVLVENIKYELDGASLNQVLHKIDGLIQKHGGDALLDIDMGYSDAYSQTESVFIAVRGKREETDKEFTERMSQEATWEAAHVARELAEYKRLQALFENK